MNPVCQVGRCRMAWWDEITHFFAIRPPVNRGRIRLVLFNGAISMIRTTCPTASRETTMMNRQFPRTARRLLHFRRWIGRRFMSQNPALARLANTGRAATRICSDTIARFRPGPAIHGSGTCQVRTMRGGRGLSRIVRHLGTVLRGSASRRTLPGWSPDGSLFERRPSMRGWPWRPIYNARAISWTPSNCLGSKARCRLIRAPTALCCG